MAETGRPFWAATHPGRVRSANQDKLLVQERSSGYAEEAWSGWLPEARAWAVIADGMGGHAAGELASELAIQVVLAGIDQVRSESDAADLVRTTNRRIFEAIGSGTGRPGMGSTLVGISILSSGSAIVFNIGDSRAYILRRGALHRLTRDHTLGAQSRLRSHVLTQSLGGLPHEVPLHPHCMKLRLEPEDLLLLCSDGLTDMISDVEIFELLSNDRRDPATDLLEAALEAGGADNVTVVVIGRAATVRGS